MQREAHAPDDAAHQLIEAGGVGSSACRYRRCLRCGAPAACAWNDRQPPRRTPLPTNRPCTRRDLPRARPKPSLPRACRRCARQNVREGVSTSRVLLVEQLPSFAPMSSAFIPCRGDLRIDRRPSGPVSECACLAAACTAGVTDAVDCEPPETGAFGSVESPSAASTSVGSFEMSSPACRRRSAQSWCTCPCPDPASRLRINLAAGQDAHDRLRGRAVGWIERRRHSAADQLVALNALPGLAVALRPAEALGGLLVGVFQVLAGPWAIVAGILVRIVRQPQLQAGPC